MLGALKSALDDTGLLPERLALDITETVLLEDNAQNLVLLREIRKLGIAIVCYSSMTYVQMFPFDRFKIDKSLIQNMTQRATMVCGLQHNLDIPMVAEGAALRAIGCSFA